jgi:hypothetical protein
MVEMGRGGHVLVGNVRTLFHLKLYVTSKQEMVAMVAVIGYCADGDDKFMEHQGTVVKDKETGEIFEITEDGEKQVLSRGERGLGTGTLEVLQIKLKIPQPGLQVPRWMLFLN